MNKKHFVLLGVVIGAIFLVIVAVNSIVYVPEDRYVCVKRFGKITEQFKTSGIKFIVPFVDSTVSIKKNALIYNLAPSDVLTYDKKAMTVSSYVVWKITDPLTFLQEIVTMEEAERKLDVAVYNAVKNLLSSMNQSDAISSRGKDLDEKILESVKGITFSYGIEIMDVQIKQFDLPQDNKEAVYNRMISERRQIAAQFTAEGKKDAEIIRNSADKEANLLLSKAKATSEQYKGEGESEYMRILSEAYAGEERAEFYEFIRSMDALKKSMKGDKTLFLPLESELAKWFVGIK